MLKRVGVDRKLCKQASESAQRVEIHKYRQCSFLFFGKWSIHFFPGADDKLFEVWLFELERLLIHRYQSLPDHVLNDLVLLQVLLVHVKELIFWFLEFKVTFRFCNFFVKSWPAEIEYVFGFEVPHKVYDFSVICTLILVQNCCEFCKSQRLLWEATIERDADKWLYQIDQLASDIFYFLRCLWIFINHKSQD